MQDEKIIGQDTSLRKVFNILRRVAPTDSTVLVTGESGTGKELVVRALHAGSKRSKGPFVPVNCGAIPHDLLESELFGHEKGAFTGALHARPGRFELACKGTLFLDEIGEMELSLQVKILRALQEREIVRVGGTRPQGVDVRVVAATNRDLEKEVDRGSFRQDLFYRLNVIPVHLPPLRERGEDILRLAHAFMKHFCEEHERRELAFSDRVCQMLLAYPWPGNVRELENFMERLSILVDGDMVEEEDLPGKIRQSLAASPGEGGEMVAGVAGHRDGFAWPCLADMERTGLGLRDFLGRIETGLIDEAMDRVDGVHQLAANRLGIKRTTLIEKLRRRRQA